MNWKPKKGEKNPNAKLTWEKVREMRRLERIGKDRKYLAEKFNVSLRTVASVVIGEHWQEGQYVHYPFSRGW